MASRAGGRGYVQLEDGGIGAVVEIHVELPEPLHGDFHHRVIAGSARGFGLVAHDPVHGHLGRYQVHGQRQDFGRWSGEGDLEPCGTGTQGERVHGNPDFHARGGRGRPAVPASSFGKRRPVSLGDHLVRRSRRTCHDESCNGPCDEGRSDPLGSLHAPLMPPPPGGFPAGFRGWTVPGRGPVAASRRSP